MCAALPTHLLMFFQPWSVFHFTSTSMEMFAGQIRLAPVYTQLEKGKCPESFYLTGKLKYLDGTHSFSVRPWIPSALCCSVRFCHLRVQAWGGLFSRWTFWYSSCHFSDSSHKAGNAGLFQVSHLKNQWYSGTSCRLFDDFEWKLLCYFQSFC